MQSRANYSNVNRHLPLSGNNRHGARRVNPRPWSEPSPHPWGEHPPRLQREVAPRPSMEPSPRHRREPSPCMWRQHPPCLQRQVDPRPWMEPQPRHHREPFPCMLRQHSPCLQRQADPRPWMEHPSCHRREPSPCMWRQHPPCLQRDAGLRPYMESSQRPRRQPSPCMWREPPPRPWREPAPHPRMEPSQIPDEAVMWSPPPHDSPSHSNSERSPVVPSAHSMEPNFRNNNHLMNNNNHQNINHFSNNNQNNNHFNNNHHNNYYNVNLNLNRLTPQPSSMLSLPITSRLNIQEAHPEWRNGSMLNLERAMNNPRMNVPLQPPSSFMTPPPTTPYPWAMPQAQGAEHQQQEPTGPGIPPLPHNLMQRMQGFHQAPPTQGFHPALPMQGFPQMPPMHGFRQPFYVAFIPFANPESAEVQNWFPAAPWSPAMNPNYMPFPPFPPPCHIPPHVFPPQNANPHEIHHAPPRSPSPQPPPRSPSLPPPRSPTPRNTPPFQSPPYSQSSDMDIDYLQWSDEEYETHSQLSSPSSVLRTPPNYYSPSRVGQIPENMLHLANCSNPSCEFNGRPHIHSCCGTWWL